MTTMRQYELWWARLPEPIGARPVLLLSRNGAYRYLSSVTVVLVTLTMRSIPQELSLGPREGVRAGSAASFDNLVTIPKVLLQKRLGGLDRAREPEVKRAAGSAFGWPELAQLMP